MVWFQTLVVPFALALGVMFGLGRMYRDNEMVVMSACGVGPGRIYKPLLACSLLVALGLAVLSLYISPSVQAISNQLKADAQQQANLTALGAGRFNDLQGGKVTFYAQRLSADRRQMENLFILVHDRERPERPVQLLTAQTATRTQDLDSGDDFLMLKNGYRYLGQPGAANYQIMQFGEYGVRVDLPDVSPQDKRREATPSLRLLRSTDPWDIAELQWRLVMPLSAIVLVVLAVPLSRSEPRQGRYGKLVLAILLFLIYYNLIGTAQSWVGRGILPPQIGLWWVPLLPLLLAVLLYRGRAIAGRLGLSG
jgi:lipopolysaccharide export system permease protein